MGELLNRRSLGESFALVLALLFVAIAVYVLTSMRKRSFIDSFPVGERRNKLLAEVLHMRQENKSRADRLKYLRRQGLNKYVAQALVEEVERKFGPPHEGEQESGPHEAKSATPLLDHVAPQPAARLKMS